MSTKELKAKTEAKEHKKTKRASYEYTPLKDCVVGTDQTWNFYAVVLDATFPHKSFRSDRFVCQMRIADPNSKFDSDGIVQHCTLMFFARRFEDLPVSQRVGDIIRVHRAYVQEYKGIKQFTSNIFFNSSWALFSPNQVAKTKAALADGNNFRPFVYFGKSFSFERSEHKIITACREWTAKSFQKHKVLNERYITKLTDVPVAGGKKEDDRYYDVDLQVKVVQVFKLDDYSSEIRVVDASNQVWFCQVLNLKYKYLKEGQYVRIRSATLEHHEKYNEGRSFGFKQYSNILSLPAQSLLVKDMAVDEKKVINDLEKALLTQEQTIMHPVIISRPQKREGDLTNLDKILSYTEAPEGARFLTRFTVVSVYPSAENLIQIQNTKTSALRENKGALKKDEKHVLSVVFLAEDYSTASSNQFAKIHLTEGAAQSVFFKGVKIDDLLKKKATRDRVHFALKQIERFNVWIEGTVAVNKRGQLELVETELKEY
ncbi:hypothetical protein FGO68_gene16809 [Halteria grandinella]|uniref:Telomeric single stranded DNA binding POT1/Cdc13 domain-containing protein n=1 Tax=Halteria grandinella TaxID=5974 RepID=A0A8J8NRP2_HALGN|nr:hypothetical protein FGO68_gene16809 [Halteria grandinella]